MTDITQKLVKELFEYKDGYLFWKKATANRVKLGDRAGIANSDGYLQTGISHKSYCNHRLIFLYFNGYMPDYLDHIDGDSLNNKIDNLRQCTRSENQHNSKIRKDNTSGVKGVSWNKASKKWHARLSIDGKQLYFGSFKELSTAESAIKSARIKHHGEFARNY